MRTKGSFCAFCQIFPFAMFLRFSDVFWITPLLYGKEAYIEPSIFNKECWSFVRSDDGSKKENNNQKDKVLVNE